MCNRSTVKYFENIMEKYRGLVNCIIHVRFQIGFKSEKQAKTSCTFVNLEQTSWKKKFFFSKTLFSEPDVTAILH